MYKAKDDITRRIAIIQKIIDKKMTRSQGAEELNLSVRQIGRLKRLFKKEGEKVGISEPIVEIETDKATMELESYKDGILLYQGAAAGSVIKVNDLLCIVGKETLDVTAIVAAVKGGSAGATATSTPAPANATAPASSVFTQPETNADHTGRIFASPLAKKLAAEKGIDLAKIKGSGDNGRIIRNDVETFTPAAVPTSAPAQVISPATPVASVVSGKESFEEVPVSQMRKVIAKRLSESLFTAPHFYLTMSVDMDAAVAARARLNEQSGVKISFNDMVVKATALALQQNPKVNSSWLGDRIRYNHHINIGVAVAVEDGLLVPVVRFANTKTLTQIGAEVKLFAQKAKDKKLQPSDWEGSTFTISNLGMFGIDQFTAIINPPDACILAVGGISQVPVVKNGQVVPGNVMKLTMSCDHRVVDGATGAAFLQTLKGLLEEPLRMLL
jgi:pyruvate dehydrogenase E2 component (dihydrolipoamide acetyltransferase)